MNKLDLSLVKKAMELSRQKVAFVPSDAAGGGGPGGAGGGQSIDPSGGMGPPPPDPSGGAAPPMDPMSGGGAPPPPPPPDPGAGGGVGGGPAGGDIAAQVSQGVSQALASSGMMGNQKPTAPKPDINTVATDIFQLKKMFLHFLRIQNIELPPDILDGPNRDPVTGAPAMGPSGGSDAQPGSSMQQAGGQPQSAIQPIQPMAGAFPSGGGGGGMGKTSSARIGEGISSGRVISKAAAVASMLRRARVSE